MSVTPQSHAHRHGADHHDHHHGDHAGHRHGPGQAHAPASFGRAFAVGIALNLAYVAAEAFYGVVSHSIALIADAGHNLGDVLGLAAAWGAAILVRRRPSGRYTYGFRSTSILVALANAVILLVATGGIVWEALRRLVEPEPAAGLTMIVVGAIGIVVNGGTALLFASGRRYDLNIRGAFLHMAADALVTLGVVAAGAAMLATGWLWLDPAVSLAIGLVIVVGTWSLLRDAVNLALAAVPLGVDHEAVEAYLRGLDGVTEVHDLHIWALSTTDTALTAHIVRNERRSDGELIERVASGVRKRFQIGHATVQLETPEIAQTCALRPEQVV